MEFALLVTITGMVVVFAALIFLTLCIWLLGKIVGSIGGGSKKDAAPAPQKPAAPAARPAAPVQQAAASDGVPEGVVAAISAAVAMMMGGKSFKVKRIRRQKSGRRPAWSTAGIIENTRPF